MTFGNKVIILLLEFTLLFWYYQIGFLEISSEVVKPFEKKFDGRRPEGTKCV